MSSPRLWGKEHPPASSGSIALLALLAFLAIFLGVSFPLAAFADTSEGSDGPALQSRPELHRVAAPILAPSFISTSFAPLRPSLPGAMDASVQSLAKCLGSPSPASQRDGQADLVAARILEKYLGFRESLTSP